MIEDIAEYLAISFGSAFIISFMMAVELALLSLSISISVIVKSSSPIVFLQVVGFLICLKAEFCLFSRCREVLYNTALVGGGSTYAILLEE